MAAMGMWEFDGNVVVFFVPQFLFPAMIPIFFPSNGEVGRKLARDYALLLHGGTTPAAPV